MKKILEAEPLTLAEVKQSLTKRGRKAELSYIQRVTLEYTTRFSPLTARKTRSIVNKLVKKFDMEENLAIQLVDILPTTTEELASFLSKASRTYSEEEQEKILEILEVPRKKAETKEKEG
ncbi:MAG: RNA polymerase Rpb4 family protein [Promethearchaeota archaeon]